MAYSPRVELSVWAIVSFVLVIWSSALMILTAPGKHFQEREYSWIGDDFPPVYPLELGNVIVMPEDTTHYQIYAADGPQEWETQFPSGGGFVQLGPQNRTFQLTVFHELRCLGLIRNAVAARSFGEDPTRLHNCFNYLRELILCRADVTLEDVLDEQHSVNHMFPHVCRDWESLYTAIQNQNRR